MSNDRDRDEPLDGDDLGDGAEDFRHLLEEFLAGRGDLDPAALAQAAGLGNDPQQVSRLIEQLRQAMSSASSAGDGPVDWSVATRQAEALAQQSTVVTLPEERSRIEAALPVAELWLDEATDFSRTATGTELISRAEWVRGAMPIWIQLAEPVASSIADALSGALADAAPEQLDDMLAGATKMMRGLGSALFAMQLGQVVGRLSGEVIAGGDIGVPLFDGAVILPQNATAFGTGLEIPEDQMMLWLSVRELAHARLYRQARWLRLGLTTAIIDYARGIAIDTEAIERIASDLDPQDPAALKAAFESGAFIPPRTPAQQSALERLETTLALIEGWVDVVTTDATVRLPSAAAAAEAMRRRRATGGPEEAAFSALVGLELRPRRLREAAAMWRTLTESLGVSARDALWSHPDSVPTAADIDDPAALVARLQAGAPPQDDVDVAIEALLADDGAERPTEPERPE